eukprot:evm.model.NODE_26557_length_7654_cov_26.259342.1
MSFVGTATAAAVAATEPAEVTLPSSFAKGLPILGTSYPSDLIPEPTLEERVTAALTTPSFSPAHAATTMDLMCDLAAAGRLHLLQKMIKEGGLSPQDLNNCQESTTGAGLLHAAAYEGRVNVMRYLVGKKKVGVEGRDEEGRTALHYAVLRQQETAVSFLLVKTQADVEGRDSEGKTALFLAITHAVNLAIVKLLVRVGRAEVQMEDKGGREGGRVGRRHTTAAHVAAFYGRLDVLMFLVEEERVVE